MIKSKLADPDTRLTRDVEVLEVLERLGLSATRPVREFDLDPCGAPELRKKLGLRPTARVEWSRDAGEDGLVLPWFGHVFVNPPYSDIDTWVDRALLYMRSSTPHGQYRSVSMLLPANRTEQPWFQKLHQLTKRPATVGSWSTPNRFMYTCINFMPKRRPFVYPDGKTRKSPPFGLVVVTITECFV